MSGRLNCAISSLPERGSFQPVSKDPLVHSGGIIRQNFWSIFLLLLTTHFYNSMSLTFKLNSLLVLI